MRQIEKHTLWFNYSKFKMNLLPDVSDEFICIECFCKIKSIFKIYQDGFKDIIQCVSILFEFNQNRLENLFLCSNSQIVVNLWMSMSNARTQSF